MREPFPAPPDAPCCGYSDECAPCECSHDERVIRAYMGGIPGLPSMTPDQRAWCIAQVRRASDATDQPATFDDHDDAALASATYWAWVDFCRDKGLA